MCSLYSFSHPREETQNYFHHRQTDLFLPREYVTPGSPIAIVRRDLKGERELALVRWGFVPSWAKEMQPGRPLINARSETVYEKASFRNAIRRRRCLMPANGFFEWSGDIPGKKQAWNIHRKDFAVFAFGGIWEHWLSPDGSELETAAMLTAEPNALVANIHDRSPVAIMPENFERWLSTEEKVEDLLKAPADDFWVMEKTTIIRNQKPAAPPPPPKPQMDLL